MQALFLAIVALCSPPVLSYSHYADHQFLSKLTRQVVGGTSGSDGSGLPPLIGDLKNKIVSQSAKDIVSIFMSDPPPFAQAQNLDIGTKPVSDVSLCDPKDTCCTWFFVSEYLTSQFVGPDGLCNDLARSAIRLGFHDAGTWSSSLAAAGQDFGGADGSFVLFGEDTRAENNGLQDVTQFTIDTWDMFNVGMADLIQYMAVHAVVTCPLGPRVRAYVGRIDATQQSPEGLLPDVHANADALIQLFEDKTISPHDLAALLGAHTTSKQFHVDESKAGLPQDTTPGVWDVGFYNETLQQDGPDGVFKFPSDVVVSQHPLVNDEWVMFTANQTHWNDDFARAYLRLSLLGVNNINDLTECTHTLPPKQDTIPSQNSTVVSNSTTSVPPFANATVSTSVPLANVTSTPYLTSTPYANTTSTSYSSTTSANFANTTSIMYTNTTSTMYANSTIAPMSTSTLYSTSSNTPYPNATASAYMNSSVPSATLSTYLSTSSSMSDSYTASSAANSTSIPYGNSTAVYSTYTSTPIASSATSAGGAYGGYHGHQHVGHHSHSHGKSHSAHYGGYGGYSTLSASTTTARQAYPVSSPAVYSHGPKHSGYQSMSHSMIVTVITTTYLDVCSKGIDTKTATYTTTVCPEELTKTHGIPTGWTTYVTVCTHCYAHPTTLTLTKPISTTRARYY